MERWLTEPGAVLELGYKELLDSSVYVRNPVHLKARNRVRLIRIINVLEYTIDDVEAAGARPREPTESEIRELRERLTEFAQMLEARNIGPQNPESTLVVEPYKSTSLAPPFNLYLLEEIAAVAHTGSSIREGIRLHLYDVEPRALDVQYLEELGSTVSRGWTYSVYFLVTFYSLQREWNLAIKLNTNARIVVDQAFVRQFEAKFAEPITAANYSLRLALELQHHPVFRIPGLRQEILQTESYGLLKPQRLPPGDQVYCLKQFEVLGLVDWDWDNVVSWYVFTLVLPQLVRSAKYHPAYEPIVEGLWDLTVAPIVRRMIPQRLWTLCVHLQLLLRAFVDTGPLYNTLVDLGFGLPEKQDYLRSLITDHIPHFDLDLFLARSDLDINSYTNAVNTPQLTRQYWWRDSTLLSVKYPNRNLGLGYDLIEHSWRLVKERGLSVLYLGERRVLEFQLLSQYHYLTRIPQAGDWATSVQALSRKNARGFAGVFGRYPGGLWPLIIAAPNLMRLQLASKRGLTLLPEPTSIRKLIRTHIKDDELALYIYLNYFIGRYDPKCFVLYPLNELLNPYYEVDPLEDMPPRVAVLGVPDLQYQLNELFVQYMRSQITV